MRIEQNKMLYIVGNYSKWDKIWPDAESSLRSAMACLPADKTIISYSSEYIDRFHGIGNYDDFDASKVFSVDSPYLSPHIFTRKQNWHSYTGYFEPNLEEKGYRILTRINADLVENIDENAREVKLLLFHSISGLVKPFSEKAELLPETIVNLGLNNFAALHALDKKILRKIVTNEMAAAIGLE
jgi:hypothetical protein